jgi:hypothetical protein
MPVSSFNFIGNLTVSIAEWQLILNKGWIFPVRKQHRKIASKTPTTDKKTTRAIAVSLVSITCYGSMT